MSRKSILDIVREWARGTDEFTRDAEVDTITPPKVRIMYRGNPIYKNRERNSTDNRKGNEPDEKC
jgi:hypothetical protein